MKSNREAARLYGQGPRLNEALDLTPGAPVGANTQRETVIREAESWLGTKFHHEARIRGVGVDCGQLLIAVYGACGFMPMDYKLAHYSPDFALHRDHEWYLEIVESFAQRVEVPEPGDLVLFKFGRLFSHGAIVVSWPEIIHAWMKTKSVLRFNAEMSALADKPRLFFSPFGRIDV